MVQSAQGCRDSLLRSIMVDPLPGPLELLSDTVCAGETALLSVMPGANTAFVDWYSQSIGGQVFHRGLSWQEGPVQTPRRLYVEPVSSEGCKGARQAIEAQVYLPFLGRILASDSLLELPEATVNFALEGNVEAQQYDWDFGDGERSTEPFPSHTYLSPGTYEVRLQLIDSNGCLAALSKLLTVELNFSLYLPSAFSPNGDGYNDHWHVPNAGIQELDLHIYDRWGRVVFQTLDPGFRWDGRGPSGQMVPEGVYVVRLKATDLEGKAFEQGGTVTLMR